MQHRVIRSLPASADPQGRNPDGMASTPSWPAIGGAVLAQKPATRPACRQYGTGTERGRGHSSGTVTRRGRGYPCVPTQRPQRRPCRR